MEIIEENQSGINIFKLNGRLDSNTSQGFEKKIFQAIDDGSKSMIIDFKDLFKVLPATILRPDSSRVDLPHSDQAAPAKLPYKLSYRHLCLPGFQLMRFGKHFNQLPHRTVSIHQIPH